MIGVGSGVGHLFGWESMDCLFLGGMLAMSSTTIIYKAFDDLGLRTRKFTSGVLSVLILEDILGILLMVILSAMAVSRSLEGMQLMVSLMKLSFFLLLWFIVGIYLVPLFLSRYKKYINSETLLIVSVGLCFLMVVCALKVGYSSAFGAFMMGSILAETLEAERIERQVASLRDLFGAIFFVSVGMLVQPEVLMQYWLPILAITVAVLLGQMIFGTFSFVISGSPLLEAMQSGFSLAQIGEFAFIIAAMGQSLGVTSDFLYPVVVAVSIVTIFFTPYMIKAAQPAYNIVERILPSQMKAILEKKESKENEKEKKESLTLPSAWNILVKDVLLQTAAYMTICVAIILLSFASLLPLCRNILTHWPGNIVCGIITFLLVAPCIRPIVVRKNKSVEARFINRQGKLQHFLLVLFVLLKFYIGACVVYYILDFLSPYWWVWHVIASILLVMLLVNSSFIKLMSIRMERTFKQNLKKREIYKGNKLRYGNVLRGSDVHIAALTLPAQTAWAGKTLASLAFGKNNIHVAAIVREGIRINIPNASTQLFPGDVLEVVGDDDSIEVFSARMQSETKETKEGIVGEELKLKRLVLRSTSQLCGVSLRESGIREQYNCTLIGFEDEEGNIQLTQANRVFQAGDILWVLGEEKNLESFRGDNAIGN